MKKTIFILSILVMFGCAKKEPVETILEDSLTSIVIDTTVSDTLVIADSVK
jgi:hypothetical protein